MSVRIIKVSSDRTGRAGSRLAHQELFSLLAIAGVDQLRHFKYEKPTLISNPLSSLL